MESRGWHMHYTLLRENCFFVKHFGNDIPFQSKKPPFFCFRLRDKCETGLTQRRSFLLCWYFLFDTSKLTYLYKAASSNQNRKLWRSYGLQIPAATACVYVTQYVDNCNCRDVVTCKSEHILPKITLYFDTHCIDISVNRLSLKRAFGKLGKQKNVWSGVQISNSLHGTWRYSLLFLYWGHYFEVWTLKYARIKCSPW